MLALNERLSKHHNNHLIRQQLVITKRDKSNIIINDKKAINFCSNDYLGIANAIKVPTQLGWGSGSSAMISGYFKEQKQLETAFAEFLQRDKAILFSSGYLANIGVISALLNRHHTALADKLCHRSILDGIHLSRAKHIRYRHNHLQDLTNKLSTYPNGHIITEGVFSMEGSITPLDKICRLKIPLLIDDAHGIGYLGKTGRGTCEHHHLTQDDIPCLSLPLGKAFGSCGAIVAGKKDYIEAILQFASSYRNNTALPPIVCSATLSALELLRQESWRREKLKDLIHYFNEECLTLGIPLISDHNTTIKSISIGDNTKALYLQALLLSKGYYVACIRPPTIPQGNSRIRISLNVHHTKTQITQLLHCIGDTINEH